MMLSLEVQTDNGDHKLTLMELAVGNTCQLFNYMLSWVSIIPDATVQILAVILDVKAALVIRGFANRKKT